MVLQKKMLIKSMELVFSKQPMRKVPSEPELWINELKKALRKTLYLLSMFLKQGKTEEKSTSNSIKVTSAAYLFG